MISMNSLRRVGVSVAFTLCAAGAMGFTAREAHAGTWTCRYIDGPSATAGSTGGTAQPMFSMGQAVLFDTHVWPFYVYTDTSLQNHLKYGTSDIFGAPWTFADLDGPGVAAPTGAATVYNSEIWSAYVDPNGFLDVAHGSYGAFSHTFPSSQVPTGKASMAVFGTKLAVVFPALYGIGSTTYDKVSVAVYDGTSWGAQQEVDGDSGTPDYGYSEDQPAAVFYNGALRVFFHDLRGYLKMRTTTNGTTWSSVTIVDGAGTGNQTSDDVGMSATTLVDAGGTLRVFYYDQTNSTVRVASSANGTTFNFEVAATNAVNGVWVPIAHAVPQLYYFDASGNIRGASRGSTGTWSNGTVDGPGNTSCVGKSAYPMDWAMGIIGVEKGGGPHLYYADTHNNSLREAFYTP